MANVIGNGTASMIMDKDGDPIDGTNRLPVELHLMLMCLEVVRLQLHLIL